MLHRAGAERFWSLCAPSVAKLEIVGVVMTVITVVTVIEGFFLAGMMLVQQIGRTRHKRRLDRWRGDGRNIAGFQEAGLPSVGWRRTKLPFRATQEISYKICYIGPANAR